RGGVGPKKAEALGRIGIRTVEDAVWMLPWRYEDRSQCRSISSLVPGEAAMIEAQVERTALKVTNFKRRKLVEVAVADRTGRLHLIWFNQAYLAETFHVGQRVMLYGQVKPRNGRWTDLQMENPAFEILTDAVDAHRADLTHMGRIVPIYHARETKSRMMLSDRLRAMMKIIVDQYGQDALEPLPLDMLRRRKLLSFGQAIRQVLASRHPMNRLIQGDVGSGKTVVAVLAMLAAVGSGYQAALMAPTEILAEQHYLTLQRLLKPLEVSCVLLTGGRGGKKREA